MIAGVVVFLVSVPLCFGIAPASNAPLMSGIIQIILGLLKAGGISAFVPSSVTRGLPAGIGIILGSESVASHPGASYGSGRITELPNAVIGLSPQEFAPVPD